MKPIAGPMDALQERLGVTDAQLAAIPMAEGEEYMSHEEFERQRPDEREAAEVYERHGRLVWEQAHGSLEGWVARREFPCPGMLRIEDQSGVLWPVCCDVCGYSVGVQVQKTEPSRLAEHRLSRAGIPAEFAAKKFEPYPEVEDVLRVCRQWVREFKASPVPGVTLWGGNGVGKSHLLTLIVRALIENHGVDVLYRSASDLLDELQAGFDEANYEQRWQRVLRVPVLALDDLGAGRKTEWRMDRLAALVDFRYSRALPLIAATNWTPGPAWERAFGPRTKSRLAGMTVVLRMEGPDRRAGMGVQQSLTEESTA